MTTTTSAAPPASAAPGVGMGGAAGPASVSTDAASGVGMSTSAANESAVASSVSNGSSSVTSVTSTSSAPGSGNTAGSSAGNPAGSSAGGSHSTPPAASPQSTKVLVIDNGSDTCKIGIGGQAKPLKLVANCSVTTSHFQGLHRQSATNRRLYAQQQQYRARQQQQQLANAAGTVLNLPPIAPLPSNVSLIAEMIDDLCDFSRAAFRHPHQKGYIVDWNLENQIWSRLLGSRILDAKPQESTLLLTVPLNDPPSVRREIDQAVFETFQFQSYHRTAAASLALRGYQFEVQNLFGMPYGLVVDCGYSFTHVIPLFNYVPIHHAVRRLDVGGKHLTHALREMVSVRHVNLSDDTVIVNHMKEKLCFLSLDFTGDLNKCKRLKSSAFLAADYVLPGYVNPMSRVFVGHTRDSRPADPADLHVTLTTERIRVPEMLFHPSDFGLDQAGIAEAIVQSVQACDPVVQPLLYSQIVVVGGTALLPNFKSRLVAELAALMPIEHVDTLNVQMSKAPLTTAWCGGSCLSIDPNFSTVCVTRQQYEELGEEIVRTRFV